MFRFATMLAGVLALVAPSLAQAPSSDKPYGFLPPDIRADYRTEIENSRWMQSLNSAKGWVMIYQNRTEAVEAPTPENKLGGAFSCAGDVQFWWGPNKSLITKIDESEVLERIRGDNTKEVARRTWTHACKRDEAPPPALKRFFEAGPAASEFKLEMGAGLLRPQLDGTPFYPPKLRPKAPSGVNDLFGGQISEFEIGESDPRLQPGTEITLRYVEEELYGPDERHGREAYSLTESAEVQCRIASRFALGRAENALPFDMINLDCVRTYSTAPHGSYPPVEPSSGKSGRSVGFIPELDLHLVAAGPELSEWTVIKESEGRWKLTQFRVDAAGRPYRTQQSILILSPEAAARYLPAP